MSERAIFSCLEIEKLASRIVLHFSINWLWIASFSRLSEVSVMFVFFEFVFDHIDDELAIVCGQFLKVLFGRWIDG